MKSLDINLSDEQIEQMFENSKHLYIKELSLNKGVAISKMLKENCICPSCHIKSEVKEKDTFICKRCGGLYERPVRKVVTERKKIKLNDNSNQLTLF